MSEQTCARCEFGVGNISRCYWPYYADGDGEAHDALFDPMPPWAERMIEGNGGVHVSDRFDCAACPTFRERAPEPEQDQRCDSTEDMFDEGSSDG